MWVSTQLSGITLCPGHTQWTWHSHHLFSPLPASFHFLFLCLSPHFSSLPYKSSTPLTVFFFYHLPPSLFLSRQKHRWKPPDKIEIMAYVQSARGANQRPSWEKHRGDGGGGGGGVGVGGRRKTRPIVPRRLKSPKRRHCPRTGINLPPPVTQGLNSILLNPS